MFQNKTGLMKELLDASKFVGNVRSLDNRKFVYEDGVYISTVYVFRQLFT